LGPRTRIQLPKADFEDEQVTDTIIMPDPRYKADVAAPATQLGQPSPTGTIVIFEREQPESAKDQLVPLPVVAWLVIVEGIGKGRDFRLVKGQNFIGRDRDMEVSLDFGPQSDTKVSKRNHAVIIFDQTRNECFIDSRSDSHKNLPLLNGSTILSLTSLKDGDIIQVADTKFRFVPLCGPAFSWS
jgi:hypothetical protein